VGTQSILVVDPDVNLSDLVADILSEEGYPVTTAQTLDEAVERLAKSHFDLVITEAFDQPMRFDFDPSFLAQIRAVAGATPIALFSTYASTDTLRAGQYGLADVLAKPFDIDEMIKKVKRVLDGKGSAQKDKQHREVA
jgi:DNA-binding response OmpR family regulator